MGSVGAAAALLLGLAIVGAGGPARAQALNQLGVQRLNQDAQDLWAQDGLPMARAEATKAFQKLAGVPHPVNDKTTATITRINSMTLDCPVAPGLLELNQQRLRAALPLTGKWRVAASADVHVKGRILGIKVDRTYAIDLEVKDITVRIGMNFDSSNPAAPRVTQVLPAQVSFSLKVHTSSWVMNALLWLTTGTVNEVGNALAWAGGRYLASRLNVMAPTAVTVLGAANPGLGAVAFDAAKMQAAALRLESDIARYRMPFGSIFEMRFPTPYQGTWEDSIAAPGFDPGAPSGFHAVGDSGEFTALYLGSLAHRYAVTRDPAAARRCGEVLAAMRTLVTMRAEALGDPAQRGNMNRAILPLRAKPDQVKTPWKPGEWYAMKWKGEDYCFSDFMSRDEYFGLFVGASQAYDLLADQPALRDSAKGTIEMALDYLVRNNWTWRRRDGSFGERWQGTLEHQYAWSLCGWRVNPAKYQALRDRYKGFADLLWTGTFISCADPYYSYYKFLLGLGAVHTALRLETDPAAWQRAYQAVAIQRHFIGHHLNAYFDLMYLSLDPGSKTALGAEVRALLPLWLKAPRRRTRTDLSNDPTIEKIDYTLPIDPNLVYPDPNPRPQTTRISKYPLPPNKRLVDGFYWSASPMKLTYGYPQGPDPYVEGETLDFVIPYWIGRYYGVIPAPAAGGQ